MFQKNLFFFLLLSFSFILWIAGGSYLHLGELEGVLPAGPGGPLDAVGVGGVLTAQVLAVKVGGVAVAVPPGTVVEGGAVVLRVVVVPVFGGELHPVVLEQRVTYGGKSLHVSAHIKSGVNACLYKRLGVRGMKEALLNKSSWEVEKAPLCLSPAFSWI